MSDCLQDSPGWTVIELSARRIRKTEIQTGALFWEEATSTCHFYAKYLV